MSHKFSGKMSGSRKRKYQWAPKRMRVFLRLMDDRNNEHLNNILSWSINRLIQEVLVERGQLHIRVPCDFRNFSIYLPTSLLYGVVCFIFRNLARYLLKLIVKMLMLYAIIFFTCRFKICITLLNFIPNSVEITIYLTTQKLDTFRQKPCSHICVQFSM
jgi:hypothetical protein